MFNKTKYNSYVKGSRLRRIKKHDLKIVEAKTKKMLALMDGKAQYEETRQKDQSPFDAEFWFREKTGLEEPKL